DWSVTGVQTCALPICVLACRPDVVHIQYATSAFDLGSGINWLARAVKGAAPGIRVLTTIHEPSGPRLFPRAGRLRGALVRRLCQIGRASCRERVEVGE